MTTPDLVPATATVEVDGAPAPKGKTRQMTFTVMEDTGNIRAEFGEGIDPLDLAVSDVPEALQVSAVTEGLISRLRGYTSKLQDDARTPIALFEAIKKGMENLKAGVWKIERAPGEGGVQYSIEVEAAYLFRQMRAKAKGETFTGTIAEAAEEFDKLTDADKKTLKAVPRYQLAYAEIKAQRNAAKAAALAAKLAEGGDETGF